MCVGSPLAEVDGIIVDVVEHRGRELGAFGNDLAAEEVAHAL